MKRTPRRRRKPKPNRLLASVLLGACGVAIVVAGVIALPHMSACAGACVALCRDVRAGMDRVVCESRCRARCVVTRSHEDVAERDVRLPKRVRVGEVELAAPELNMPIARLAKAAVQLRAPLAPIRPSATDRVDLRPERTTMRSGLFRAR
ncbi:MAG: hypothetical protein ACOC1F_02920 [Myxococcota bacterium]